MTILALAERALRLAHGALGVVQPLLALHPEALHAPLEILQTFPERLLTLAEPLTVLLAALLLAGLGLLTALPLLAALALLPPLALLTLARPAPSAASVWRRHL